MLSKKLLRAGSRYQLSPAADSNSNLLTLALPFNTSFGLSDVSPIIRGSGDSYNITTNDASLDTTVQKFDEYVSSIKVGSPYAGSSRIKTSTSIPAFGSSNFCIESWIYVPSIGNNNIAIFYNHNDTDTGFQLLLLGSDSGQTRKLYFSGGGGGDITRSNNQVAENQWVHIACTRSSNTLRLFINGVRSTDAGGSVSTNFTLSRQVDFFVQSEATYNTVRVQDFRVYQGVAKYTSNFTPPGAMFT